MYKVEVEFRNKQKKTFNVPLYYVGKTVLILQHEESVNIEYINLRDISRIHAIAQVVITVPGR